MMRKGLVILMGVGLAACGGSPLMAGKSLPDETAVIDAPMLTLPPNFDLRPPQDGSDMGEALLQAPIAKPAEPADAWLIQKAGRVDPNIRQKLAQPQPDVAEEEVVEEEAEVEVQDDRNFWNVWGGWKPSDEAQ